MNTIVIFIATGNYICHVCCAGCTDLLLFTRWQQNVTIICIFTAPIIVSG